jgi:hypothetical protein
MMNRFKFIIFKVPTADNRLIGGFLGNGLFKFCWPLTDHQKLFLFLLVLLCLKT